MRACRHKAKDPAASLSLEGQTSADLFVNGGYALLYAVIWLIGGVLKNHPQTNEMHGV